MKGLQMSSGQSPKKSMDRTRGESRQFQSPTPLTARSVGQFRR